MRALGCRAHALGAVLDISLSPRVYKVPPNIPIQPEFPRFEQRPSKTLGLRTQKREEDKVILEMGTKIKTMEMRNLVMVEDASIAARESDAFAKTDLENSFYKDF